MNLIRFPSFGAAIAIALLCAHGASAQVPSCGERNLETNIGTALNVGDDVLITNLALGFSFTFPDGSSTTAIDVSSNGRITPAGALPGPGSGPDGVDVFGGASSICPLWSDLRYTVGDVFFNTTPTSAIITWQDVDPISPLPSSGRFTFQVVLNADSTFRFNYDSRATGSVFLSLQLSLVGTVRGNSAIGPPPLDLSAFIDGPGDSLMRSGVFESFGTNTNNPNNFDLGGLTIDFAPNGLGGFLVSTECGRNVEIASSCTVKNSAFRFTPTPTGSYDVTPILCSFETNVGVDLGLSTGGDSVQPIPFPFTLPGGVTVNSLQVTSFGRIIDPGVGTVPRAPTTFAGDFSDGALVAASWAELALSEGGSVSFRADASSAVITWLDIPHDTEGTLTFQAQLFPDSSFNLCLGGNSNGRNLVIGAIDGAGGPLVAPVDLSSAPITGVTTSSVFERFGPFILGTTDVARPMLMKARSTPQVGGCLDLVLECIPPGATNSEVLIGTSNPNTSLIPLLELGVFSCTLVTGGVVFLPVTPLSSGFSTVASVPIPNNLSLMGLSLFSQGVTLDPSLNPLGFGLGSGIESRIGL